MRLRVEGERIALPAPVLTPYLVGLLVLLGMLGTLLGMMDTLRGTGLALQSATDMAAIRGSLASPVQGLAVAFGTSIAGVASSAMLGLLAALLRRDRLQAVQQLDRAIAGDLHPYSQAWQRAESLRLLQAQSAALPALVDRLQAMTQTFEQHSTAANERLLAGQAEFLTQSQALQERLAVSLHSRCAKAPNPAPPPSAVRCSRWPRPRWLAWPITAKHCTPASSRPCSSSWLA